MTLSKRLCLKCFFASNAKSWKCIAGYHETNIILIQPVRHKWYCVELWTRSSWCRVSCKLFHIFPTFVLFFQGSRRSLKTLLVFGGKIKALKAFENRHKMTSAFDSTRIYVFCATIQRAVLLIFFFSLSCSSVCMCVSHCLCLVLSFVRIINLGPCLKQYSVGSSILREFGLQCPWIWWVRKCEKLDFIKILVICVFGSMQTYLHKLLAKS